MSNIKKTAKNMKKVITDPQKIDELLDRGTIAEILPSKEEFRKKLLSGQRLRFYIGFDPTGASLHLSHAKNFMLMERFRLLGHETVILFGDFTARIGDPTGKESARRQLTRPQVLKNVKQWQKLVRPLMDFSSKTNPPRIMYNHKWLAKLDMEDLVHLASNFTVQQMIERDMFQKRMEEGKPIFLHEFLYPLMQGYDSVAMDVDAEVCGTDQIFNALAGRTLLKKLKNKEKFVVAVTLMENPKTGELMSKSRGTGVFLDVSANDMYGQVMAQPDEMIELLFVNNTLLSLGEIETIKRMPPRDAKMRLAFEVTKIFHGEGVAQKAQDHFVKVIQQKQAPEEIKEFKVTDQSMNVIELLVECGLASSKSDARRLVVQKGIKFEGETIEDIGKKIQIPAKGGILQKGSRYFVKIAKK